MTEGRTAGLARFALAAALLAALAGLTEVRLGIHDFGVDDANITFAYARNLAAGHGLRYQPAGERVEGFTSLLWTLLAALAYALGLDPKPLLLATSVIALALALARASLHVERKLAPADRPGLALFPSLGGWALFAWCLFSPGWVVWGVNSLLETGLWSALVLLGATEAVAALEDPARAGGPVRAALLGVLLLLVRPDGFLWAPVFLALHLVAEREWSGRMAVALRRVGPAALVLAAAAGGLTAFRLLYFGWPLPNTWYAKVSPDLGWAIGEGLDYLKRFLAWNSLLPPACFAAFLLAVAAAERLARGTAADRPRALADLALVGILAGGLAVPVALGGDHFAWFRFFQPVWPLIGMAALAAAGRFGLGAALAASPLAAGVRGRAAAAVGIVALWASHTDRWNRPIVLEREFQIANREREVGEALARTFRARPPRYGAIAAGGIAMTYDGPIVDLMGLNDVRMGHSSGDRKGMKNHAAFSREVFFELAPDLLVATIITCGHEHRLPTLHATPTSSTEIMLKGLLRDAAFRSGWVPGGAPIPGQPGRCLFGYYRAGYLAELTAAGVAVRTVPWPAGGER